MANPIQQAGGLAEPSKYAPIHTNRFFTGLWTQRNPLRDAATTYIMEKFYSGSRFESLYGGVNTEITSKLTLRRRPGNVLYNSQDFPAVQRFYEFRVFSTTDEIIRIMADTSAVVYDATGPNTKNAIWTKNAGAGSTYFHSIGNTLYFGNGVDQMKWLQTAKSWQPNKTFTAGDFFVDPNNNLQQAVGAQSFSVSSISIKGGVATVAFSGQVTVPAGVKMVMNNLTVVTFMNAATVTLASVNYNTVTFAYAHADMATTSDSSGTMSCAGGATSPAEGAWPTVRGSITFDNHEQWICKGPSVQKWGIDKPTTAPSVANTSLPTVYPTWVANTYYSPSLVIADSNGNLQSLTTSGTLGATAPVWATVKGATTADGTAVWTCMGTTARANSHAYVAGDVITVAWTTYITVKEWTYAMFFPLMFAATTAHHHPLGSLVASLLSLFSFGIIGMLLENGGGGWEWVTYEVDHNATFQCTTAGISGAAPPGTWNDGVGSTVADGQAIWTCVGNSQTWASIGASTLVTITQNILDGNGNLETIKTPGKSGAAVPAWATVQGTSTTDNLAIWSNSGPYSKAGTAPQVYAYAFKNSLSSHVSTASQSSSPITVAANDYVMVQGQGSTDPQVDMIQVYRTLEGGSSLLLLDEIPAPLDGSTWTYADASADSDLNYLIQAQIASSNNPPPAGAIAITSHLGRLWVIVGNTLYFSAGPDTLNGSGNESFPPLNSFVFPSQPTRTWSCSIGLIVMTVSDMYVILGTGTASSPFYQVTFQESIGLLNYDAFTVSGSTAYLLTAANKCISLDPSAGRLEVGAPIGDQLNTIYDPQTAYLTFHEGSTDDTALYVADGGVGWFRMAATAAPESGFVWSPQAVITGGCQAVASLETAPGVRTLLVGPGNLGGKILKRDLDSNNDNTANYAANVIIGSIVLAQPGQIADIDFLTFDSIRTGTRPTISVLLDEIAGNFELIPWSRQDPPLLPASTTLFNDRYYLSQDHRTTFCRHFQVKLEWAAEDAANELLTFTIFGAVMQEKRQ